jgi:type I restriction enzyme S subunit
MKEGWSLKSVKDVASVIAGQSPEGRFYNADKVGLPFYQGKKEFGERYIKPSGVWTSVITKIAIAGDILMSVRAPVGPVNVSVEEICIGRGLAAIRQKENVIHDFLFYFFKYYESNIKGNTGAVFDSINKAQIENIPFLIPPLSEQQRIVSIIDEAFEAIDKAIENTQKNLQNAKELFESYLNSVFENSGEGWVIKSLIEICNSKSDIVGGPFGSNLKVEDYTDHGIPILRLQNIGKGYFINKDIKYISESKAEDLKYHSFKRGDIALAKLGIPIGKTCIIPDDFNYGIVVADVVRIRPNQKVIDVEYLNYFLNSDISVAQLTKNITGSTRPRVNIVEVRDIKCPIPPIQVQRQIVVNLNALNLKSINLQSQYQQKLANLEELKKSILNKAFAGEL